MEEIKLIAKGKFVRCGMEVEGGRIFLKTPYNKTLIAEIKSFEGAKWHGYDKENPRKLWSIKNSGRNIFQLSFLMGQNPYERYDNYTKNPVVCKTDRSLYKHQIEMVEHGLTVHYGVWAAEMGCLDGDYEVDGASIEAWYKCNSRAKPRLHCYDENGDIITVEAYRIVEKEMECIHIKVDNHNIKVGKDHLFLAILGDELCHVRAKNLTQAHMLITDGSIGIPTTSTVLTQNKKHIGLGSGMEMVQSINKKVLTEVSFVLRKLNLYNNLPETLNVLKSQIMGSLYFLEQNGYLCLENPNVNSQSSMKTTSDTLSEDFLMQMVQSQYQITDNVEIFIRLSAMLQKTCYQWLPRYLEQELLKGTIQTKYQLMEDTVYRALHSIFIQMQLGISNIKQIDFEKPGHFIVARESEHLFPASLQRMKVLPLRNAEFIDLPNQKVYDLTIPKYGNYFTDDGINHQNTGKSLAAIEVMEQSGFDDWYWIGPRSALKAARLEFSKWDCKVKPVVMTYEGLRDTIGGWIGNDKAPHGVIFDESSKIKTPTALRSQAALQLAEGIREDWKMEGFCLLLSGSPAPKSPADWYNQCIPADTYINTSEGIRSVKDLVNQTCYIIVNGKKIKTEGFFKTGTKQLYKIETKEGYSVRATEDHRFMVDYDSFPIWRELQELKEGDNLVVSNSGHYHTWNGIGTYEDGYIIGLLYGDGSIDKNGRGLLQFFPDDFCIMPYVQEILNQSNISIQGESQRIYGGKINSLIKEWELNSKKEISNLMLSASSDFIKGFLSGFFDADGYVRKSTLYVALSQVNRDRIYKVQLMLQSLGIYSTLQTKKNKKSKIKGREINTSLISYELIIIGNEAVRFYERVGFNIPRKNKKLKKRIKNRHTWRAKETAKITSITKDKIEDVYDITVPEEHCFSANGLVAHNCEVSCPGFLKEGDINKFKNRLGLIVQREQQITGGTYPYLITWLDDENKCKECGEFEDHINHDLTSVSSHHFTKSKNEIEALYRRMKGLAVVIFKEDCLDLPAKTYKIIECKPTQSILQVAKTIIDTAPRVVTGLTLARELSDGFQYREEVVGKETCPRCKGAGEVNAAVYESEEEENEEGNNNEEDLNTKMSRMGPSEDEEVTGEMVICDTCGGRKEVDKKTRIVQEVPCPKVNVLIDLLDQYDEEGRVVIYGGFTGSIDRITSTCTERKWVVLRVDGRGWHIFNPIGDDPNQATNSDELLIAMDRTHPRRKELLEKYPRIAFVGQPGAAGMGLNLTASPVIIYYSNDFNAESRIQSEDRIHRSGMDVNLGATIIDIIHLETDVLILENLKKKRDLQAMSLGAMKNCMTMKLPREVDTIVYGSESGEEGETNA